MVSTGPASCPPHDGGAVFQKPPLVFWAAHLCLSLLGRSAFAARLPGALAGAGTVFFGALFAAEAEGALGGALAGAFLVAAFGVVRFSRELMLDLPLCACVACALWGAAGARRRPGLAFFGGLGLSLSLGIKGPIGPALILLASLPPLVAERSLRPLLRTRAFWWGTAAGLAVALPWFRLGGDAALGLLRSLLHSRAVFRPLCFGPRAIVVEPSLGHRFVRGSFLAVGPRGTRSTGRRVWPLAWILSFFALFLLPKEHGLHYPLLILPPLATLAARGAWQPWTRLMPSAGVGLVSLGLLATLAFPEVPRLPVFAACAMGLCAAWLWSRCDSLATVGACLLTATSAHLALAWVGPALGRPLLSPEASAVGRREPVTIFWDHPGPYLFAGPWRAHEVFGAESLIGPLNAGALILAREHTLGKAPAALRAELTPVVRWRRSRPYLTFADVWAALQQRDLDALGEWVGLYRRLPENPTQSAPKL